MIFRELYLPLNFYMYSATVHAMFRFWKCSQLSRSLLRCDNTLLWIRRFSTSEGSRSMPCKARFNLPLNSWQTISLAKRRVHQWCNSFFWKWSRILNQWWALTWRNMFSSFTMKVTTSVLRIQVKFTTFLKWSRQEGVNSTAAWTVFLVKASRISARSTPWAWASRLHSLELFARKSFASTESEIFLPLSNLDYFHFLRIRLEC